MSWQRRTAASLSGLLLLLAGCEGDRLGRPTGDTADFQPCEDIYDEALQITDFQAVCTAEDRLRLRVTTKGWTSDAVVFSQATGVAGPQLADEHDVATVRFGVCQDFDELERTLVTEADPANWEPNVSSPLSCSPDDDASHADPDVMTYVIRVYDLEGNLADCVAVGHDPAGLLDGSQVGTYTPTHPEEWKGCRQGFEDPGDAGTKGKKKGSK
ncbi:MAG: hypothetical protein KTR31_39170 [Myxococcales bacterium]|nr:hypothetical protein [Myxococcales bacterium]